MIGCIEDEDGAAPRVELGRYLVVVDASEFLEWASSINIQSEDVVAFDNGLNGIWP